MKRLLGLHLAVEQTSRGMIQNKKQVPSKNVSSFLKVHRCLGLPVSDGRQGNKLCWMLMSPSFPVPLRLPSQAHIYLLVLWAWQRRPHLQTNQRQAFSHQIRAVRKRKAEEEVNFFIAFSLTTNHYLGCVRV